MDLIDLLLHYLESIFKTLWEFIRRPVTTTIEKLAPSWYKKIFNNKAYEEHFLSLVDFGVSLAALFLLVIKPFVVSPYFVLGSSMEPNFHNFDYLIVEKISYRFSEPRRGDVIVLKYPLDTSKDFLKRVIALPGERIKIEGKKVTIFNKENPNGFVLKEPYLNPKYVSDSYVDVALSDKEYFVMGDNRGASSDSRYWGPLPREDLVGRVVLRLFPFSKIDIFPAYPEDFNKN